MMKMSAGMRPAGMPAMPMDAKSVRAAMSQFKNMNPADVAKVRDRGVARDRGDSAARQIILAASALFLALYVLSCE